MNLLWVHFPQLIESESKLVSACNMESYRKDTYTEAFFITLVVKICLHPIFAVLFVALEIYPYSRGLYITMSAC